MVTGTHIHYYFVCHRKLWLFANGINMEHTSEAVADGKLLHETSYGQRAEKHTEIAIDGIKIDFYDAHNRIIHETKRSDAIEEAHTWQLKYYIYVLRKNGIEEVSGILEYPRLRQKVEVRLNEEDSGFLEETMHRIGKVISAESCPQRIPKSRCRQCAYFDFCWSEEE